MNRVETKKRFVIGSLLLLSAVAAYMGARFVPRLLVWRHLDQTYQEQFPSPAEIAPELEGKKIVFHIKTGLDQDGIRSRRQPNLCRIQRHFRGTGSQIRRHRAFRCRCIT